MLFILSPSKTIEFTYPLTDYTTTTPLFEQATAALIDILQPMSARELGQLMKMSDKLADENYARYQSWANEFTEETAHPALFSFKGGVYQGLDAMSFDQADITVALDSLIILSGLYGMLRPMDLMQAYRLEMGTRLSTDKGSNLYHYWTDSVTQAVNKQASDTGSSLLINLASEEYSKVLNKKTLKPQLINIDFKEERDDTLKFVSFNAKKARGMMANYIIKTRAKTVEDLTGFAYEGYRYQGGMEEGRLLFVK